MRTWVQSSQYGSSPLARGTLRERILRELRARLIPACAGNIRPYRDQKQSSSAHPRSRGEHATDISRAMTSPGSSPLTRGTPGIHVTAILQTRLIPARAGNTSTGGYPVRRRAAHPRSRGEHACASAAMVSGAGSSPLARGTRTYPLGGPRGPRLISAGAGNILLRV